MNMDAAAQATAEAHDPGFRAAFGRLDLVDVARTEQALRSGRPLSQPEFDQLARRRGAHRKIAGLLLETLNSPATP